MKKRITIPAIVVMIIIIMLILFKCSGKNGQTPEPSPGLIEETSAPVPNDTLASIEQADKVAPEDTEGAAKEADLALKEAQLNAETARQEAHFTHRSLESLERFINSLKPQPQVFYVNLFRNTQITGDKGTCIHVNPWSLETIDGSQPTDSIRVELMEVLDQQDMILHNIQTMSGDSVLISDGMFRLELFAGEKRLRIKERSGLQIAFPQNSRESMSLFFGVTDETGSPDWELDTVGFAGLLRGGVPVYQGSYEPIPQEFVINESRNNIKTYTRNNAPRTTEYQKVQRSILLFRPGWYNIDKFLSRDTPRADLTLRYQDDSVKAVKCYIIFKDLNSLVTEVFYPTPFSHTFQWLPDQQNIRIMTIGYRDTIPFISDKEACINRKLIHEPVFARTTEQELKKRISNLW